MDQWDNQKLEYARGPVFDSRQFLFFYFVYQEINKRYIKTRDKNVTICIVLSRAPHSYL